MRGFVVLTIGISLGSLACKRAAPPLEVSTIEREQLHTQTLDDVAVATPLRTGVCPSQPPTNGLQLAKGHRATIVDTWDGLASLQAKAKQAQAPLGARTRGLLASTTYFTGDDCHAPRPDARNVYSYSTQANSHHALYFPSTGAGFNFLPNWSVPLPDGGVARYDAAMFGPNDGLPCLHACAHFVELEVNGGRGGLGLHFVATSVEVIDEQYGMDVARVLDELRERFAATVDEQQADVRRRYADAQRDAKPQVGDRVDEPLMLWPSWSEQDRRLEVLAMASGRAVGSRPTGSETIPPADCPPGAPCAYREVGTFDLFEELTITHEIAVTYRVDDRGTLIDERVHAARVQVSLGQTRRRR